MNGLKRSLIICCWHPLWNHVGSLNVVLDLDINMLKHIWCHQKLLEICQHCCSVEPFLLFKLTCRYQFMLLLHHRLINFTVIRKLQFICKTPAFGLLINSHDCCLEKWVQENTFARIWEELEHWQLWQCSWWRQRNFCSLLALFFL